MESTTKPTSTKATQRNRSAGSDFFNSRPAALYLEDGTTFKGISPADQQGAFVGEIVFNTGMTGYVESLTDPSYSNQMLVFTYPLIGNYGVQPDDAESAKIQVNGVIMSEIDLKGSHSLAAKSLLDWLQSQGIPLLTDVDTRRLTKHLRSRGTMIGTISDKPVKKQPHTLAPKFPSIDKPTDFQKGKSKKIILVDCGAKGNILRSLLKFPVHVRQVPYDYDYTDEDYDGVFISNGPGDPTDYKPTIAITKKALAKQKPVFGICLGSQLMGLAAGARTYKLPFGHRGHNQPCMETDNERCFVTSQNHGYAIDEKSLPTGWEVWFRNLNDSSVEGIRHRTKPFMSVQFHPEACPGPTDTSWLFDEFYALVKQSGQN